MKLRTIVQVLIISTSLFCGKMHAMDNEKLRRELVHYGNEHAKQLMEVLNITQIPVEICKIIVDYLTRGADCDTYVPTAILLTGRNRTSNIENIKLTYNVPVLRGAINDNYKILDICFFFSTNKKFIITINRRGARLWDLITNSTKLILDASSYNDRYDGIGAICSEGTYFAMPTYTNELRPNETISIINLNTNKTIQQTCNHQDMRQRLYFSAQNKYLVAISYIGQRAITVSSYALNLKGKLSIKYKNTFELPGAFVSGTINNRYNHIALLSESEPQSSTSSLRKVHLLRAPFFEANCSTYDLEPPDNNPKYIRMSPDGKLLVTGNWSGSISIYNVTSTGIQHIKTAPTASPYTLNNLEVFPQDIVATPESCDDLPLSQQITIVQRHQNYDQRGIKFDNISDYHGIDYIPDPFTLIKQHKGLINGITIYERGYDVKFESTQLPPPQRWWKRFVPKFSIKNALRFTQCCSAAIGLGSLYMAYKHPQQAREYGTTAALSLGASFALWAFQKYHAHTA